MKIIDNLFAWGEQSVEGARRRVGWFDHALRAMGRYGEVHAGRLAAAISYYGFFATFALAMLAFAILAYLLGTNEAVVNAVTVWLEDNLPFLNAAKIEGSRRAVGIIGLVGFLLTGIGWVESIRSSIRAVWHLDQEPGNYFIRRGVDIVVLIGLGLLVGVTIGFSVGARAGVDWLRDHQSFSSDIVDGALSSLYLVAALCVNWVLAAALLTALPRLKMPLARLVPAAMIVAVGLELLKSVGQYFITRTENNPAYQVVIGAVGLLIFLNVFNQLLLWAAALTATSRRGTVRDLAAGPKPEGQGGEESRLVPDA